MFITRYPLFVLHISQEALAVERSGNAACTASPLANTLHAPSAAVVSTAAKLGVGVCAPHGRLQTQPWDVQPLAATPLPSLPPPFTSFGGATVRPGDARRCWELQQSTSTSRSLRSSQSFPKHQQQRRTNPTRGRASRGNQQPELHLSSTSACDRQQYPHNVLS